MAFNEKLPEWLEEGIEPPESKRKAGWQINDKPPAAWLNWFFNRVYKVMQEIRSKFDTHTGDNTIHVTAAERASWSNKVDKVTGKQLSTEDYLTAEKTKLAGIAAGANNYTHPANHPASIITQDANNRFVTDAEKAAWNAAETNAKNASIPKTSINTANGVVGLDASRMFTAEGEIFNGRVQRRVLTPVPFTNVANQKFEVYFTGTRLFGYIELTLSAGWNGGNGGGKLTKRINIITALSTEINYQQTQYTEVTGNINTLFSISDITWDATLSKFKLTIEARAATLNQLTVEVKVGSGNGTGYMPTVTISDLMVMSAATTLPKAVEVIPDDTVSQSGYAIEHSGRKNVVGGYAGLDATAFVADAQIPPNIARLATVLPSATNLNSIISEGDYHCDSNSTAGTFTNMPSAVAALAFGLRVTKTAGSVGYNQLLICYSVAGATPPKMYTRNYYNGTWSTWQEIETTASKGIANGYAGLDSNGFVLPANLPYGSVVNMLSDSGRFSLNNDPSNNYCSDTFANNASFSGFNGAAAASAGKFIYDNNQNGGVRGTITEDVVSLVTALQAKGSGIGRYGPEFHVASYTQGSGTSNPHPNVPTAYLLTANSSIPAWGLDQKATYSFWFRLKTGTTAVIARSHELRKNGVVISANYISVTAADGWMHIESIMRSTNGYSNGMPGIYVATGEVAQIAIPVLTQGGIGVGVHLTPIMGANVSYTPADVLAKLLTVDGTGSGLDADLLAGKTLADVTQGAFTYAVTTGTATALAATFSPTVSTLKASIRLTIKAHAATTGPVTLNVNGLGAKSIKKPNGNNPTLALGGVYTVVYDGSAFILQGEGGEYGTVVASNVLAGVPFGTENGLANGTMINNTGVAKDSVGMAISGGDIFLNPSEGYYNPTSSIHYYEANLADSSNWRSDRTLFGKAGTMPVISTGDDVAQSIGQWPNGDIAVYPREGYRKGGAGAGEIKVTNAQLKTSIANFSAANIRKGTTLLGLTGTLIEGKPYATGTVNVTGGVLSVRGLSFRPWNIRVEGNNSANTQENVRVYDEWDLFFSKYVMVRDIYPGTGLYLNNYSTVFTIYDDGFSVPWTVGTELEWKAWGN